MLGLSIGAVRGQELSEPINRICDKGARGKHDDAGRSHRDALDVGLVLEPHTDDGEVCVVVIADVDGFAPHALPIDEHGEAALLQAGLSDQRFRVVQEAVAVVSDSDQQDVPTQLKKALEG